MYTLQFKVQNKELKIISEDDKKESFIRGSFNIDKLEFDFSEDWDKLSKKVIYKVGDKSYAEAVIDNEAIVSKEVYENAGFVEISVVGFINENGKDTIVLPTNAIRKLIYDTNSTGEEPANLPDESTWDAYQKKIEDFTEEAKKAEANAKTSAEAAENVKNEVEKSVDGFDETVEKKTTEFNKNAEEKTTEFNKNTEQLYKDIEALESLAPLSIEAGTIINIDNAKAYKIIGEVVDGKYQQDATPSPDQPQEITQINSATLNRCGKNMCLTTLETYDWKGITVEKLDNGKFKVNGTAETALDIYIANKIKMPLVKDTYYKLSKKTWSGTTTAWAGCNCRLRTPTGSTWSWLQSGGTAKQAPAGAYIDLIVFAVNKGQTYTDYIFSTQLESVDNANSAETSYEAYNGQSINIDLSGNEVCALSDTIKDQLIIDKNGNVTLKKNIAKLVLDGSENWRYVESQSQADTAYFERIVSDAKFYAYAGNCIKYSNLFIAREVWNGNLEGIYLQGNNRMLMLRINKDRLADVSIDSFKTWLSAHNVITYYELNVPQIIELPKLTTLPTTLSGTNHIWVETNLGVTNIEIKYVEDLQREVEKLKIALVALEAVQELIAAKNNEATEETAEEIEVG